jgi:RNA polymerase sigma-70 factor (ECF subfamily)
MDDVELVKRCRMGDRAAQRALYDRFGARIHRLALRISGNQDDAFDITQNTFVLAYEKLPGFDGRAAIGTWLYRIGTNEALQLLRRRRTDHVHRANIAAGAIARVSPESDRHRPDVEAALEQLSDEYRALLVLRYQEGLNYEEIADAAGLPVGTVASRLSRARAAFRKELAEIEGKAVEETGAASASK